MICKTCSHRLIHGHYHPRKGSPCSVVDVQERLFIFLWHLSGSNGHLAIMQTRKCVSKVRKNDLKRTVHALEGQVEEERVHAVFLLPARDHNDCGGGDRD